MKLKFYINEKGRKIYTMKEKINGIETKSAHYKYLNLAEAKKKREKQMSPEAQYKS